MIETSDRRPLKTRKAFWVKPLASSFVRLKIKPNQISCLGILISAIGSGLLMCASKFGISLWHSFFIGVVCVQLRLLCNMLDGFCAVEYGMKGKAGGLFNELPDRLEDTMFLVAAGFVCGHLSLGWAASAFAIGTAYVRALGGSLGQPQDFCGPQAKQHRMALLTFSWFGSGILLLLKSDFPFSYYMLLIITIGTIITMIRRSVRLYRILP
jgi:phosphatidylglycerophosphate synthase